MAMLFYCNQLIYDFLNPIWCKIKEAVQAEGADETFFNEVMRA